MSFACHKIWQKLKKGLCSNKSRKLLLPNHLSAHFRLLHKQLHKKFRLFKQLNLFIGLPQLQQSALEHEAMLRAKKEHEESVRKWEEDMNRLQQQQPQPLTLPTGPPSTSNNREDCPKVSSKMAHLRSLAQQPPRPVPQESCSIASVPPGSTGTARQRMDGHVSSHYPIADLKQIRETPLIHPEEYWRLIFPGQSGYIYVTDDEKNSKQCIDLRTAGGPVEATSAGFLSGSIHWSKEPRYAFGSKIGKAQLHSSTCST